MKIGIIGAGIAGLAASIRLSSRGHQVTVFEANDYPGGKLSEIQLKGYRFDAGPSLFTMPMYVDELFDVAKTEKVTPLQYKRLPVVCNYFWEDGTRFSFHADEDKLKKEVENTFGEEGEAMLAALKDSGRKYQLTGRIFLEHSLHRFRTWWSRSVLKALTQLPALDIFKSMDGVNRKFFKHPKLVQLFNRFATYNGSNPYKASGILNIIPHFEHHFGAYFPEGGMHGITMKLFELAKAKGVQFQFNEPVESIEVGGKEAKALRTGKGVYPFDRIVSNMDIFFTYRQLLKDQKQPEKILAQEKSSSALIFYWGIKGTFPELDLHNILFSDDYRKEFDHIASGKVYKDPTIYINITQKYRKEDAPEGCENWFTMINVPFNAGQDWEAIIERSRKQILEKLERILGQNISDLIECEAILDPRTIESRTRSHLGALYGTSSNHRMAAFLRHPNFSRRIRHLYFCGGSAHPGGGIPLCLLSAKIIDQEMHA